jgi:glycerol-3-phosphate dehydrogenase (NAD(P)+)
VTKLAVIGAGAWGSALGSLLATRSDVSLWVREPEVADAINGRHENPLFLPDVALTPALIATTDIEAAVADAEAILMAVPAQHFRSVLATARPFIGASTPFITLTKGIEDRSLLRMSEVATEVLEGHDPDSIGVLSGPNIAREVVAGQPAATVIALRDPQTASVLQQALMCPSLRVYTNPDVVGCEIGGAVKNVIALAAGMATGLGFGGNTLAALVTRGLAELARLGVALGGQPLTFLGLAGIGDLVVTCNSPGSRNRHVGEQLGQGRPLAEILSEMTSVAEGVRSCGPVLALGRRAGVELPICEQVGHVLEGRAEPVEAVDALLRRDAISELHGIT